MRNAEQAHRVFRIAYKGQPNLLTPHILERGIVGKYAVELSEGEGMDRQPIYGVTVVDKETCKPEYAISTCLSSIREAYAYIDTLKGE